MSPAFPTGAYTFSHGLESAIADGAVFDAEGCPRLDRRRDRARQRTQRRDRDGRQPRRGHGGARGGDPRHQRPLPSPCPPVPSDAAKASCSAPSFREAAAPWFGLGAETDGDRDPLSSLSGDCALPVAVGALSARSRPCPLRPRPRQFPAVDGGEPRLDRRPGWCRSVSARRLATIAALEAPLARLAETAAESTLDDLGGCAVRADIDSLRHERQRSRVCRS